jgi:tungstate transport system substrate-binding protein
MSWGIGLFLLLIASMFGGCIQEENEIVMATTTSTYDSGLLDYLLPVFEDEYGIEVKVVPVGTGRALEYGRRGDVDVILVHSPEDEKSFVSDGFGTERHCVMYNDFLIVGPKDDPAGIKGKTAIHALRRILNTDSQFISRGDSSGTHKKELALWGIAGGYHNLGSWYVETGTGMGKTLLVASEKEGYTLVDRGTYTSMKKSVNLDILVSGDELLTNPYGIMAVNPETSPGVNNAGAQKLITWIMSDEAQQMIADFTKDGEQLFVPLHGECLGE